MEKLWFKIGVATMGVTKYRPVDGMQWGPTGSESRSGGT